MNLQFYLTESKLSCPGIVIGTFFNYLDFPTHYICGTMNFKKPTHDSWQRDAGYEDSLQSKSPVVDEDLVLVFCLIDDLRVRTGRDSVWLHVPERTGRQVIGSYLFLLSHRRTDRQAVARGNGHQPPGQSPQSVSGVSLFYGEMSS